MDFLPPPRVRTSNVIKKVTGSNFVAGLKGRRNLTWAGGCAGMEFRKLGEVTPVTGFWRLGDEVFQGN